MVFTHDTRVALRSAAALVNTLPDSLRDDRLGELSALEDFVAQQRWTGPHARTQAELEAVRALRPRLRRLWTLVGADTGTETGTETGTGTDTGSSGLVTEVNAILAEAGALPQLVEHDGFGWHIHATAAGAPLQTRMSVEAAMAFVDVIRLGELDRLTICAADDCGAVVVDLSRNRSRRFCEAGCGNRENVRAYRERRAGAGPASQPVVTGSPR